VHSACLLHRPRMFFKKKENLQIFKLTKLTAWIFSKKTNKQKFSVFSTGNEGVNSLTKILP
ncbi:MAG: hypothetical protein QXG94_02155, partial [Candidatus Bathyarchaeia archaeon]